MKNFGKHRLGSLDAQRSAHATCPSNAKRILP
jgi:hypothetical protein